jgi:hypothetical protein
VFSWAFYRVFGYTFGTIIRLNFINVGHPDSCVSALILVGCIRIQVVRNNPKRRKSWGNVPVLLFKCDILQFFVIKSLDPDPHWPKMLDPDPWIHSVEKTFFYTLWPSFSLSRWILRNRTGHGYILFDLGYMVRGLDSRWLILPPCLSTVQANSLTVLSRQWGTVLVLLVFIFSVFFVLTLHI